MDYRKSQINYLQSFTVLFLLSYTSFLYSLLFAYHILKNLLQLTNLYNYLIQLFQIISITGKISIIFGVTFTPTSYVLIQL